MAETAAKLGAAQGQVVAEHVKQRRRRVHIYGVRPAVDFQIHSHIQFLPIRREVYQQNFEAPNACIHRT